MRVLSSAGFVDSADQIVKKIINAYLEPNKSFPELRQMASSGLIDPLRIFSEACRAESEGLDYGPPGRASHLRSLAGLDSAYCNQFECSGHSAP